MKITAMYYYDSEVEKCKRKCIYCHSYNLMHSRHFGKIDDLIFNYNLLSGSFSKIDITYVSCVPNRKSLENFLLLKEKIKQTKGYNNFTTVFRFMTTGEFLTKKDLELLKDDILILSIDGTYKTMSRNRNTNKKYFDHLIDLVKTNKEIGNTLFSTTFHPGQDYYNDLVFIGELLDYDFKKMRFQFSYNDGVWSFDEVDAFKFAFKKYIDYTIDNKLVLPKGDLHTAYNIRRGKWFCPGLVYTNKLLAYGTCLMTYSMFSKTFSEDVYKLLRSRLHTCSQCKYKDWCQVCSLYFLYMCNSSQPVYCYIAKTLGVLDKYFKEKINYAGTD